MMQLVRPAGSSESAPSCPRRRIQLDVEPGETWWGGSVGDGSKMPYGLSPFSRDLSFTTPPNGEQSGASSNQSSPLLISTTGRVVWSERPFTFGFSDGRLTVVGQEITSFRHGHSLREAFMEASRRFFPPSGRAPAIEIFTGPQYNTWIDQPHRPTQKTVLTYARELLDAGMPPGVVCIDDCWSPGYGTWYFDTARFPDPSAMVKQLHDWGCSVMLWLVPFIDQDNDSFQFLETRQFLLRDKDGNTAIRRWWNGESALLDLSNPDAIAWFTNQLDAVMRETGVDGFKFDGGDVHDHRIDDMTARPATPVDMCQAWAELGLRYSFNEFRACWRMGGQPLAQRLRDKPATWGDDGLGSLIPEMLAQSMIGHCFTCPDMIGGGEISTAPKQGNTDQEFFVRYAQIAALSPIAQFSTSPPRVLDDPHLAAVRQAIRLRDEMRPTLLRLVEKAAATGEPIVVPMAFYASGLDAVTDQYFFGPDMIVAPVLKPGATSRRVLLPEGQWRGVSGDIVTGPATVDVACGLDTTPRFVKVPTQQA